MEKISGILPKSPRVASVDLSEAPPVRPGAPTHGRPEGKSSVKDRVSLNPFAKEQAMKQTLTGKNAKEASRAETVAEINRKFFDTRIKPQEMPAPPSSVATQAAVELPSAYKPSAPAKPEMNSDVGQILALEA